MQGALIGVRRLVSAGDEDMAVAISVGLSETLKTVGNLEAFTFISGPGLNHLILFDIRL